MGQRRMFSPQIIDSDAFLDMPSTSQSLYFHLGMRADDDGFVGNPRKILRMIGGSEDDMKILLAKRFILSFETGVIVIKHWRINNLVRKDWYKETIYLEEKNQLKVKENGAYTELVNENATIRSRRLGKVRLGKVDNTTPKGVTAKAVAYGNESINAIIQFFEVSLNSGSLDGSRAKNRQFAHHILNRMKKDYPDKDPVDQVKALISFGLKDPFHGKNLTSFEYLYRNTQKIIQSVKNTTKPVINQL